MIKIYWFKFKRFLAQKSGVRLTSETWQKLFPEITVLDPDGWDRRPEYFGFEWYIELLTYDEYMERVIKSTIMSDIRFWM